MTKRPVSIKQVADAAGVSTATVSNVFSGKKPVKPELAQHVRDVAANLGYRINRSASNLRSGESRVIAVLVPDLSDPFFTSLVTELEGRAQTDGYDLIIANAQDDVEIQRRRINALLSWQPAGMVIVPCSDEIPDQIETARDELPIVVADRGAEADGFDTVRIDSLDAGHIAGRHLMELGHRDVLIVASDLGLRAIRERSDGARELLEAAGAHVDVVEVGPAPKKATESLIRWLERNPVPTAIFAVTDMTTLSSLAALADRKLEVGDDVSVLGFDDYPWMTARRTPITAVHQPIEDIADNIWATLSKRLNGSSGAPTHIELQCTLNVRASTRRIARSGSVTREEGEPARGTGKGEAEATRRKPMH
ncbi:MAG: LacI family DNA-binding transcriptional regulator [Maritimibacter sp.]|nr:LacI family DNA-binding transcriptional regulator [Maritimibacter sp.]